MNIRSLSLLLVCLFCFTATFAQTRERSQSIVTIEGVQYYVHTVAAGETLSSIGRLYEVSPSVIARENPHAEGVLRIGAVLRIPVVRDDKPMTSRQMRRTFDVHSVAPGETLFGISRRYGISIATLMEDNPKLDPLHIWPEQTISIRKADQGESSAWQIEAEMQRYRAALASVGEQQQGQERPVGNVKPEGPKLAEPGKGNDKNPVAVIGDVVHGKELNIGLLLPLSSDGAVDRRFVEFYRGALLGLEDIKRQGISASVRVWDAPRSEEAVARIVASEEFGRSDLVIGPVYAEGLTQVVEHASRRGVPVVSPLSVHDGVPSPALYQMAPVAETKYDKIKAMTERGDVNVVYVTTPYPDEDMDVALRPVVAQTINYTSGTSGATFESRFDRRAGENLYIVSCTNAQYVDQILNKLSSMHSNLVARGSTSSPIRVVGNANWAWFASGTVDREVYFKVGVCYVANYHVDRSDPRTREFDRRYIEAFGEVPPSAPAAAAGSRETRVYPYAYRGYDAVKMFVGAAAEHGYDYTARVNAAGGDLLQVTYRFGQSAAGGDWRNTNWALVSYRPDYTITVE